METMILHKHLKAQIEVDEYCCGIGEAKIRDGPEIWAISCSLGEHNTTISDVNKLGTPKR